MNEPIQTERLVTDWLSSGAPSTAPTRVLTEALARVADTGQERYLTQRLLGDQVGRSPSVRMSLAVAAVALAVIGAALAAGALLPRPPIRPQGPAANGWIVFVGNGHAGPTLDLPIADLGSRDNGLYIVRAGQGPRQIVGTADDGIAQTCPSFSPDGTHLAYREADLRGVPATPPPVPSGGADGGPSPSSAATAGPTRVPGSALWTLVITAVRPDGTLADPTIRLPLTGAEDSNVSCPLWSPDGTRLAYATDPEKDVWIVALDGRATRLAPPPADHNADVTIAWSPDGQRIANAYAGHVWVASVGPGVWTSVATGEVEAISWSPDGTRLLLFGDGALRIVGVDGTAGPILAAGDPRPSPGIWSPDGRRIAVVVGQQVRIVTADGTSQQVLPLDLVALAGRSLDGLGIGIVAWSPDGSRLLVSVGQFQGSSALVSVPLDDPAAAVVLVPLTQALTGGATWQAVYP